MKHRTTCMVGHVVEIQPAVVREDHVIFGSNADFCDDDDGGRGPSCEAHVVKWEYQEAEGLPWVERPR
jgi:hypothetical protein